ncbi:hypothetical protein SCLCIDRAFT_295846 [Scleroderma citrinum Foug A]|uniref:Uncharacterized protein n=1 Tax=Scleroderma citrinum Foug A TaxID=1036808 RepID=A0A0C3D407_9AGAM|nr:hypothetical protein SCLCIDRAFT_751257 [Scleroderma citrinum Foug A]KIM66731.1 hypothetical protein SCLCIDRAFT_295846 [Scleroderma citrinum Foug A]
MLVIAIMTQQRAYWRELRPTTLATCTIAHFHSSTPDGVLGTTVLTRTGESPHIHTFPCSGDIVPYGHLQAQLRPLLITLMSNFHAHETEAPNAANGMVSNHKKNDARIMRNSHFTIMLFMCKCKTGM